MNQSIPVRLEGQGYFRQRLLQRHGNVRAFGLWRTLGSLVKLLCMVNVRGDETRSSLQTLRVVDSSGMLENVDVEFAP